MTTFYTPDGYQATATYDAENRLKTVTYTGHSYTFYYDGDGLLAKQVVDGVETRFIRDGYLCLQERNNTNAVTRAYAWGMNMGGGIGGLLELKSGTSYYSYLYNGRGDVTALIDSLQAPQASYKYDPFGVLLYKGGTLIQPYQFSTKYYYSGPGLNYYGYRFDNPMLGKWMTRDPLDEMGGWNLYGFAGNSPIDNIDPYGLHKKDRDFGIKNPDFWKWWEKRKQDDPTLKDIKSRKDVLQRLEEYNGEGAPKRFCNRPRVRGPKILTIVNLLSTFLDFYRAQQWGLSTWQIQMMDMTGNSPEDNMI